MPSTGKPSKDCYRCRQRRVKCDLERLECRRCLRLGQPCPGYRTESELTFRNESRDTYQVSTLRDRRKANVGGNWFVPSRTMPPISFETDLSDMAAHISLFDRLIYGSGPPPWGLSESWDNHAIPFIISQFSAPTKDGARFYGFMDFFPGMVAKAKETSTLVLCCKAVAFMYFTNKFDATPEDTGESNKAFSAYGKALKATNAALSHPDLSLQDETLVSIWLLSVYETLSGATMSLHCPGRPPNWNAHILGLISLVRMKTRPQFLSGNGRRFFWMLMAVVEARALGAGTECPEEIFSWLQQHMTDFVPEELDMHHVLVHGYHATVLCANIRRIVDAGQVQESQTILRMIEDARKLGGEAEATVAQDSLTRSLRLRQAHIHNIHRAVRIHVQYSILELLQFSSTKTEPKLTPQFRERQRNDAISTVQNLTQNTLATIPYILGPKSWNSTTTTTTTDPSLVNNNSDESDSAFEPERSRCWADGLRFLWPLRVIGSRRVITKNQRDMVEHTLQRLDTELCMRAATVPYAIPQKMQLPSPPPPSSSLPINPAERRRNNNNSSSRGCKTCRKRKVKCDGERNECQRCRTSQFDCEGYDETVSPSLSPSLLADLDQGIIGRLDEPGLVSIT